MSFPWIAEFTSQSVSRMEENTRRIIKCFTELSEAEIWQRPNPASNSMGNLVLHLCGNIRQYIISGLEGEEDTRQRDLEFSTRNGITGGDLLRKLEATTGKAMEIILDCTEDELLKEYEVQGFRISGLGIILHVTEHYSYHTGQIAFYTKMLKNKDLGFYAGIDLNVKNRS